MANQEHVDRLLQGVEAWNQWRWENPSIKPDFSSANLLDADLRGADLRDANLSSANLRFANLNGAILNSVILSRAILANADLSGVNLSYVDLNHANFFKADLSHADLSSTDLSFADLSVANLSSTNLSFADLSFAYLSVANLSGAYLKSTDLSGAYLRSANLSGTDLRSANLSNAQALRANLQAATLTGACIEDWNINSSTNLQEVICKYVFTRYDNKHKQFTDRRPHDPNQIFAPGEFTKRYQIVLETVDLFFHDGIDWTAFLDSLHDLQSQYGDELSIRDIGRRAAGSFVVQLEVPPESDKGTIERQAKELYATKLQQLEAHYQERLQLRGEQLLFFQEQVGIERIRNTRLERIIETMAEKDSPRYDLRGARFGGGFAADGGTQTGGTFNDFSHNIEQNINEIDSLIQSLRSQAEAFPEGIRQETLEHIGDLESDIQQPPEQRKPSRIKATLLALAGMATLVSGAVAGANEFAGNLQELSEKLGLPIPIEQLQPQSQPDAIDVKAIGSDRS